MPFAVIESIPSLVPRLFGGISFVHAEYVVNARASASSTLPNFIFRAALRGETPFLSPREVAKGESGAMRRRALLHYLRRHLEELRPYG